MPRTIVIIPHLHPGTRERKEDHSVGKGHSSFQNLVVRGNN